MSEEVASAAAPRTQAEEKAFYDDMWSRYGHLDAASPAAFHRRRMIVKLAAGAPAGARVLDVGCGQGELLREIAAKIPGAKMAGADLSAQSLADSRRRNPDFELFELDIADPKMPELHPDRLDRFDLVICSEVLEHIPDDQRAARNLTKLLAPGGRLIATVPGGKMSHFDRAIGHQRHYTRERLASLISEGGMEVVDVLAWGFPFHNLYRSAVRVASRFSIPGKYAGPAAADGGASGGKSWLSRGLSAGYVAFGRVMNPLFFLNLDHGGEQMIAVARRP